MSLPDLAIVPIGDLYLHEEHDDFRVRKLTTELRRARVLRNPPVVAAAPSGGWVVLDGANRTEALRALGARHVVVQRIEYGRREVGLASWRHAAVGPPIRPAAAYRRLEAALGVPFKWSGLDFARAQLRTRRILAWVWIAGRILLVPRTGSVDGDADRLRRLVAAYAADETKPVHRVRSDDPQVVSAALADVVLLAVFPTLAKNEILTMARRDLRLPAGVTRHTIPGRALHVDVPVSLLMSDSPPAEKNTWLAGLIRDRVARQRVRTYDESTIVFDE